MRLWRENRAADTLCGHMRHTRLSMMGGLAIAAAALSGCIHKSTTDLRLGGVVELEAISETAAPEMVESEFEIFSVEDRSNWPDVIVLAPNDPTTELARFTTNVAYVQNSPRQRTEWPKALSAVDRDLSEKGLFTEAFAAPFWAGLDVLLIPFRTNKPQVIPYERSRPTADEAVEAPMPDEESP